MTIVYTDAHQAHQPTHEIYDGEPSPYPELAARAETILGSLRQNNIGEVVEPEEFPVDHIQAVHHPQYVEFLRNKSAGITGSQLYPSYFIGDTYAPLTPGTFTASKAAADVALTGAKLLIEGQPAVYSLCRPPGHHAEHNRMGGYCYFNNAAIAAEYLSANGKVAILDIDFHHGNGTQEIFYERDDVLYVSLHADPANMYPYISGFKNERGHGEGEGFNNNYPLALGTGDQAYLAALTEALEDISKFQPAYLVVSCGFDTFKDDPVGGFGLSLDAYKQIGQVLKDQKLPTLIVQEGGYNVENLGVMATNLLQNFAA